MTTKLLIFSILQCNLFTFITQTRLYCSKQLETTLINSMIIPLHITFKHTVFIINTHHCTIMLYSYLFHIRADLSLNSDLNLELTTRHE